jgi:aryl-phospho-beta-D-glucosidase BglC (GH1 family)
MNQDLIGLKPIEIMDKAIEECGKLGLKVILDNHSREPDAYMTEYLWYVDKYPHKKWIEDWVFLAKRYRGNDALIGMDLNNEPHNNTNNVEFAAWGTGDPKYDWKMAAEECGNEILKVNPHVLIIIEGVQRYKQYNYWWGGNLIGVKDHPVKLSDNSKLVYSPHEYGPEVHLQPWYQDTADFPANMKGIWDRYFGYIYDENIAPLLIGEFGIANMGGINGKAGIWFDHFLKYMAGRYSWTFWCWNPNSGDTGGILAYDWVTLTKWKVDKLKPYLAPMIQNSSVNLFDKSRKKKKPGISIKPYTKNGQVTMVQYGIPNSGPVDITVYDAEGKVFYRENKFKNYGLHYVKLGKSNVKSGIYFIKFTTSDNRLIHKLITY